MKSSIVSYPNRGNYGRSNYIGNCSGLLIKDLLLDFKPRVFVDPTLGSGTSLQVVEELNETGTEIEFFGLDLHSGFNLIKDSLSERIGGQRADFVFCHPPYASVHKYSGEMWGNTPHPDDLSRCVDYTDFLTKMATSMLNIYDALKAGGRFSILIGDLRKDGVYTSIQADLLKFAPGTLDGIIIKAQHNCRSDRKTYGNAAFTPINHEYLLNFRKDRVFFGILDTGLNISQNLESLSRANWSGLIRFALNRLGGTAALPEIYQAIERDAPQTVQMRKHWRERVRCELQRHFRNVERGIWAIA